MKKNINDWWGNFTFDNGECALWQIGPSQVKIQRKELEWLIFHEELDAAEEKRIRVKEPFLVAELETLKDIKRYIFKKTSKNLKIFPRLADRAIVTRPTSPIYLSAGEESVIFISSPLWFSVSSDGANAFTEEFPILRPSDTWFGPDTQNGEICYASKTSCRLYLEDFPYLPHRAVTPLKFKNYSEKPILIERINLPVKYLSLYRTEEGYLWTQGLSMRCEDDEITISLKINKNMHDYAGKATLVSPPRVKLSNNVFKRALDSLLG